MIIDEKKKGRYQSAIDGYKRFIGRKNIEWFEPPKALWRREGLRVSINPELGLNINAKKHVIKLYFKKERLSKRKIDVILEMMEQSLRRQLKQTTKVAVLDVTNSKLFSLSGRELDLEPLLIGEASSFVAIWNRIK